MKLARTLSVLLFTVLLLWGAANASAVPGQAEVKKIVGSASVIKGGSGSVALKEGDILKSGDTVTTGRASTVDLWLGVNGDALRIEPDSTLRLDTLDIVDAGKRDVTTAMSLGKGQVTGNVIKKLSDKSKYEIKTATGVAGIRGTIYSVRSDGTLVVTKGVVEFRFVINGVSQTVRVEAGKQFKPGDAAPSVAPAAVVAAIEQQAAEIISNTGTGTTTSPEGNVTVTQNPLDVTTSN